MRVLGGAFKRDKKIATGHRRILEKKPQISDNLLWNLSQILKISAKFSRKWQQVDLKQFLFRKSRLITEFFLTEFSRIFEKTPTVFRSILKKMETIFFFKVTDQR